MTALCISLFYFYIYSKEILNPQTLIIIKLTFLLATSTNEEN